MVTHCASVEQALHEPAVQMGVGPVHWLSTLHCVHLPALSQMGALAFFCAQALADTLTESQPTHTNAELQIGVVGSVQWELALHCTHLPLPASQ